jgi:DNA-binding MarR family transcriptional regulator
MATANIQENINWLLIRASMLTKQRLMKLAEEYDLTLMQALTVCLLEPAEPTPMAAISELLSCDPSNVTGIVERLSVGNYIERRENPQDRRVKTITLTTEGEALRSKLLPRITDYEAPNLGALSEHEITSLKKLLTKMIPVSACVRRDRSVPGSR